MQKIDFFGGLHGNYLELVIDVSINQSGYGISKSQFLSNGACHTKNHDTSYVPITLAGHWSFRQMPFMEHDRVIQIVPAQTDMLIAVVNSFSRLAEPNFDLDNLEHNTLSKITKTNRLPGFLDPIIKRHGKHQSYSRSILRNHFFSMFDDAEHGLNQYKNFDLETPDPYRFCFRNFFDTSAFFMELNSIAYYLNQNFYPTPELVDLHQQFLTVNQGLQCEVRCQRVIQNILNKKSMDINLNIVEEAWINYIISRQFRCYDLPCLATDAYPTNTIDIANAIYHWKQCN